MPRAFLLMPFDPELDWLRDLIRDAGTHVDVDVTRADDIFASGIIIEQIRKEIDNADAVIAVCTGRNANVFFELGLADRRHRPVLIARGSADLPFDIGHFRAHFYERAGVPVPLDEFRETVARALTDTLREGTKADVSGPMAGRLEQQTATPQFDREMGVFSMARSYAGIVVGAVPETGAPLRDVDLDNADRWFDRLGDGQPLFSNPEGTRWQESKEHPPRWTAGMIRGPVVSLFWAPTVRVLDQQRGRLDFGDLVGWWINRIREMTQLVVGMGVDTVHIGLVLATQPSGDQAWISEFGFGGAWAPKRGPGIPNVGIWKGVIPPKAVSEIAPYDLFPHAEDLLRQFGYRHVEPTLHRFDIVRPPTTG